MKSRTLSRLLSVSFLLVLANLSLIGSSFATATGTATRRLPTGYTPGTPFTVDIKVVQSSGTNCAVNSTPPAGAVITNITNGGQLGTDGHVRWIFQDAQSQLCSYDVTMPAGTSGAIAFSGVATWGGGGTTQTAIDGDTSISLGAGTGFHPADLDGDLHITLDEYSAYLDAFVNEKPWPAPPSPVTDIDILSKALQIVVDGDGFYVIDDNQAGVQKWVPALPPQ